MSSTEFNRQLTRFEESWQSGVEPTIADFLHDVEENRRPQLLVELVSIDMWWRAYRGQPKGLEQYIQAFPEYAPQIEEAFNQASLRTAQHRSILDTMVAEQPALTQAVAARATIVPPTERFSVLCKLGEGAFGTVWKAYDSQLCRLVALKSPSNANLADEYRERFIRESRAAARLSHDGIVSVYDVCMVGAQQIVIVSQFINGSNLAELQREHGRFSCKEAAALAADLADALAHAHAEGIIHRDLKPANILVDSDGKAYITDFGLAKDLQAEAAITKTGDLLGTVAYMPPEQAAGGGESADARSDVYGVGIVLYEMVTGERPFRGTVQAVLQQVINDPPLPPQKLDSGVSSDLQTIILKCLEKRVEHRYQSTIELRDDLLRYVRNEPIVAKPPNMLQRFLKWYPWHSTEVLGTYFVVAPLTWVFFIVGGLFEPSKEGSLQLSSLYFLPWALLWIANGVMILKRGLIFELLNIPLVTFFLMLPLVLEDRPQSIGLILMIGLVGCILHGGAIHGRQQRKRWLSSGNLVSRLTNPDSHRDSRSATGS